MKLFSTFTLTWWQFAFYETALISLGILVGAAFHEVLKPLSLLFGTLFIIPGTYILAVLLKQAREKSVAASDEGVTHT